MTTFDVDPNKPAPDHVFLEIRLKVARLDHLWWFERDGAR
jgi:hypothetical protein